MIIELRGAIIREKGQKVTDHGPIIKHEGPESSDQTGEISVHELSYETRRVKGQRSETRNMHFRNDDYIITILSYY